MVISDNLFYLLFTKLGSGKTMLLLIYQIEITCRFDRKNHFIQVNLLGFFLDSLEILECFCLSYTFLVNFVHQRIFLQSDICLEVIEKRYKVIVTQINSLIEYWSYIVSADLRLNDSNIRKVQISRLLRFVSK